MGENNNNNISVCFCEELQTMEGVESFRQALEALLAASQSAALRL